MITLILRVRRATHVSRNFFEAYWRDKHGPLVIGLTEFTRHLTAYKQFHLVDCRKDSSEHTDGEAWPGFDGVALLSFKDVDAVKAAFREPRFVNMAEPDTLNFANIPASPSFLCHLVGSDAPPPSRHGGIALFEFADSNAAASLRDWVIEGNCGPKPNTIELYESLPEPFRDGAHQEPPTNITACSFNDVEEASEVLTFLTKRNLNASSDLKPIYAIAREYVFI
jgi:hypothetical protein